MHQTGLWELQHSMGGDKEVRIPEEMFFTFFKLIKFMQL